MPNRINLALDGFTLENAVLLSKKIGGRCNALKVHDLVDSEGAPRAIPVLKETGTKVWVDYKLHDTSDTVGKRAKALRKNGADIITVHASGGVGMMKAAVDSGANIIAVTILTSLEEYEVNEIYGKLPNLKVPELALKAKEAGCYGIVCSPREVGLLYAMPELEGMKFITPGVRSSGVALNDQKRVDTPRGALLSGADQIVVGRQVTEAENSLDAFDSLLAELSD